jgi:hypothetical protein
MDNPWVNLPTSAPFVLPSDKEQIDRFNGGRPEEDKHRIHLTSIPEAFLGQRDAQLVLLNLNPGYNKANLPFYESGTLLSQTARLNLIHASLPYPFWVLNPAFNNYGGHKYWRKRLRRLIGQCSSNEASALHIASQNIFCVEYFPYHSVKYGRVPFLESQNYGFHLVREAIQRKAVIVIMRAKKRWLSVVPELQDYQPCFDVGNFQNPCISCQNTPDGAWPPIVYAAQGMKPLSRREIDEFADSIPVTITDMVDPVTGLSRFVDGEGDATVVSPPPIDVLFDGPEGDYSYDGDGEWAACCMGSGRRPIQTSKSFSIRGPT